MIARKLKKAAIAAEKEKTKKEIEVQLKKLKEDQETLERKKDVAEQLYEEKVSETRKINFQIFENLYIVRGGLFFFNFRNQKLYKITGGLQDNSI